LGAKDYRFVLSYVSSKQEVAKHSFLPLIHSTITERRYKCVDEETGLKAHKFIENGRVKSTAKKRQIYYATHLDSQIYSYYSNQVIGPKYEVLLDSVPELSDCITAYRRIKLPSGSSKNNIHFAHEVFSHIRQQDECVAISFDISKFFDSLDHKLLKKMWCKVLGINTLGLDHYNIYKSLTRFSFIEMRDVMEVKGISHVKELKRRNSSSFCDNINQFKSDFLKTGKIQKNPFRNEHDNLQGIPQGTPISSMLANLYLFDFDRKVLEALSKNSVGFYRRYSDDLVVVCKIEDVDEIEDLIVKEIANICRLTIHPSKSKKHVFRTDTSGGNRLIVAEILPDGSEVLGKPLQYLGFEFDGTRTLLKSSSLAKYYRKLKHGVRIRAWRSAVAKKKKKEKPNTNASLYRKKLYLNYSHLGKNRRRGNYLTYAHRAAEIMHEPAIKRQASNSWRILAAQIEKYKTKYDLSN